MSYASLLPIHPQLRSTSQAQKVLVIDDVEMNAALIASVVGSLCDVQIATSSQQGLDMALQYQPDLILLDVLMPEMDGFEVFRRLKNTPRTAHIPVIFLTGIADKNAEELGLNMGAADFIAKPFRSAVLLARVRNHLELAHQRQLLERLSHIDGLTGIANRRYFNTMLSREFSRTQRHQQPLAVLMIDVDDFKALMTITATCAVTNACSKWPKRLRSACNVRAIWWPVMAVKSSSVYYRTPTFKGR